METTLDVKTSMVKLDSDNYDVWAAQMEAQLVLKECYKAIEPIDVATVDAADAPLAPADVAAAREAAEQQRLASPTFKSKDQKAKALITLAVADHLVASIKACGAARAAWQMLADQYAASSQARVVVLKSDFNGIEKGPTEPITKYLNRAKALRDKLKVAGHTISDLDYKTTVLKGLPSDYDTMTTFLTYQNVAEAEITAMLLTEEARIARRDAAAEGNPRVLLATGKPTPPANAQPNADETRTCFYCNKKGHVKANCRLRKRHQRERRAAADDDASSSDSDDNGASDTEPTPHNGKRTFMVQRTPFNF